MHSETDDVDVSASPDAPPTGYSGTRLLRRAGTHREPRMVDWRRRAGRRSNVAGPIGRNRGWLAVVAVAIAATAVVGGTHYLFAATKVPTAAARGVAAPSPLPSYSSTVPSTVVSITDAPSSSTSTAPATSTPSTAATTSPVQAVPPARASTTHAAVPVRTSAPAHTTAPRPSTTTKQPTATKKPTTRPPATTTPAAVPVTGTGAVVGTGGQCLDVINARDDDGTGVQIFTCNGSSAQTWSAQADGTVRGLGKCLAAGGGDGSTMEITTCDGSDSQKWQVIAGTVKNSGWGLCLDVQGGSAADGTVAIAATCSGSATQKWSLN